MQYNNGKTTVIWPDNGSFDPEAVRNAALDIDIPAGGTIQGHGV